MTSFLSPLLTVATQAAGAKQNADALIAKQNREDMLQQAMQSIQLKRQQENDAIANTLKQAQTNKALTPPIDPTKTHATNRDYDIANPLPEKPISQGHVVDPVTGEVKFFDPTKPPPGLKIHPAPKQEPLVITADPNDPQAPGVFTPRSQAAGKSAPTKPGTTNNLPAPMAAKVGQFGEMLKKAHDLSTLTDNLDVTLGQSASRDLAEHGVHVPFVGTLPGSKGVGSYMQSKSPEYAQYQAALSPFILAAAHALSGARINQDQVEQIRKSIELAPGDFGNKAVRAQKEKNMIDLINSIGGSLPPEAIGQQESQMDEASLAAMAGRGYRRIGGAKAPAAPARGRGGANPEAGLSDADLWEQKRQEGMSAAQATAYVRGRKRG